jgi:DNA-binding XRE family transcriptional regulator
MTAHRTAIDLFNAITRKATTMTNTRTADYQQINSLTDTIVVIGKEGHRLTFETLEDYDVFQAGVSAMHLSLYDDTTGRWLVGTLDQLVDESPGAGWPERLRVVRKAMGMTQAQMAQALGYSHATRVAELEAGKATITPMLERLITAYERTR